MRTVLVTGVAGFIGSSLAERLLDAGDRVIGVDNFDPFYDRTTKESNLRRALSHEHFCFLQKDLRDAALLREVKRAADGGADVIVHLAAKAGVRPSIAAPLEYVETNVTGTAATLELARKLGIDRFVFGSSSSVYGNAATAPFKESEVTLVPISPYAASKRAAEILCDNWARVFGMRCVSLRFFTVVGERQRPDLALHAFTRAILEGRPIQVFGDGSMRRDFTYIGDIVNGLVSSLDFVASMPKGSHEIINLGGHNSASVLELIRAIERALSREARLEFVPRPPGDVDLTCADIAKATRLLGFAPRVALGEAAQRFANWYLARSAVN
jgi:UDP-glucuronate 4-epimerase